MLLPSLSGIVAPPSVGPAQWAELLAGRRPLVLAPSSARGWFGGTTLVAWDPVETHDAASLAQTADALQSVLELTGDRHPLCAALATYDGDCTIARYEGGLVLDESGWRVWGSCPELPASPAAIDAQGAGTRAAVDAARPLLLAPCADFDAAGYRAAVRAVRERIAAGDVYVLNLTYRLEGTPALAPADAFATLVERAGSDFSAMVELPDGGALASVSPERFVRVTRQRGMRTAEIWPIKGTRPRGASPDADAALAAELRCDAKELAEHVMVVDLERNDLGRVCVPGTVRVESLYEVARTPYCHQLVSVVSGDLRSGTTVAELLESVFPCGSVTGAPKIAAIRIARELEHSARGAYCGALLVAVPGELDSSVLIRTLQYSPAQREHVPVLPARARWGTGGGVTIESDPAAEWLESVLKASPVMGDGRPGTSLLETCRVVTGCVPLLDRHLARLARGGCGPTVLSLVRERIAAALSDCDPRQDYGRLRVVVRPDGSVEATIDGQRSTLEIAGGPRVALYAVNTVPALPNGAAKPFERAVWDRAHASALARGAHQALLVLPDDTLVDGSTASIWVRVADTLITPNAPPAVDGVGRGVVFDAALDLGYEARADTLSVRDLEEAAEVFLTNALGGVAAVRGREGHAARQLGEVFAQLWAERPA